MIELLLAGALFTAPLGAQDPSPDDPAVKLSDVTVTGRPLEQLIHDFVTEVAEPNRGRGLARWESRICVGVVNLRAEVGEYLADRISTVAEDMGLTAGEPGCTPNLVVVATGDGSALAREMVDRRHRAFRIGGSGMDRGGTALNDFVATDRPIRWWQVAIPIDSASGAIAVRIPGQCSGACSSPLQYAPIIRVNSASRIHTQIVDRLLRTLVVVDIDEVADLSILQLADYIAMVSLAQIDPTADTSSYASILNVFQDPGGAEHLTDWDLAYLDGLYQSKGGWQWARRASRGEVSRAIRTSHLARQARLGEAEPMDPHATD